jgi:hypothetical protein
MFDGSLVNVHITVGFVFGFIFVKARVVLFSYIDQLDSNNNNNNNHNHKIYNKIK